MVSNSEAPSDRLQAIGYLVNFGGGDTNAVAALVKALKDQDATVRASATDALQRLDPAAAAEAGFKRQSP
jgi:HEAT repeat protein